MRRFLLPLFLLILIACQPAPPTEWHWERVEAGLPRQTTTLAAAIDPADPNRLWLGAYASDGLSVSLDGGQTWTTPAGLDDNPIFDLLFTPQETGILWAAARDGLFLSRDGGLNWQPVKDNLPVAAAFSLATDASGRIYAGLDDGGIYRQTETGWQTLGPAIDAGLPPAGDLPAILSLAVSPDGQQLYAGTAGQGVFASRDGGQSWVNTYPRTYVPNLALNPANPQIALASLRDRLVHSHDGGQTWHTVPVAWAKDEVVSLLWPVEGVLGAGTGQGRLYLSRDGGDTWLEGGSGLPSGGILDLAATPTRWLAATWTGLYVSDDGGASWHYRTPNLGSPHANTLLTTPDGLLLGSRAGLFSWQPDSRHWTPLPGDFPPGGIASLADDPANPQILYAGTSGDGIYRRDNSGDTWRRLPALGVGVPAVAVDPQDSQRVYLLAAWERVYESRDGGQNWQARWAGLGDTLETVSLAVDPVHPLVYVGAEDRLYRSVDGRPWELAAPVLAGQTILALLAQPRPPDGGRGSVLYIGATRGIYRSLDGGLTVQGGEAPPGLGWGRGLENVSVTALLADPQNPARLLAGTAYAGVYQSLDWGFTWQPLGPAELAGDVVKSLAWGPEGELFVAAANGVWAGR